MTCSSLNPSSSSFPFLSEKRFHFTSADSFQQLPFLYADDPFRSSQRSMFPLLPDGRTAQKGGMPRCCDMPLVFCPPILAADGYRRSLTSKMANLR
jgi:hypothetical protein